MLGSSPEVGVVGYSLGGGIGWLLHKSGLATDSVRSLDLVTAAGHLLQVSSTSHPDLFWGLRGGGGNFGVVTALEFALYPVVEVYGGNLYYPLDIAPEVFAAYRQWIQTLPDEWSTTILIMHLPPLPQLPEPLRSKSVVVRGCYLGGT
jgi:FAD/FMN-containing dehydrogenase